MQLKIFSISYFMIVVSIVAAIGCFFYDISYCKLARKNLKHISMMMPPISLMVNKRMFKVRILERKQVFWFLRVVCYRWHSCFVLIISSKFIIHENDLHVLLLKMLIWNWDGSGWGLNLKLCCLAPLNRVGILLHFHPTPQPPKKQY